MLPNKMHVKRFEKRTEYSVCLMGTRLTPFHSAHGSGTVIMINYTVIAINHHELENGFDQDFGKHEVNVKLY